MSKSTPTMEVDAQSGDREVEVQAYTKSMPVVSVHVAATEEYNEDGLVRAQLSSLSQASSTTPANLALLTPTSIASRHCSYYFSI